MHYKVNINLKEAKISSSTPQPLSSNLKERIVCTNIYLRQKSLNIYRIAIQNFQILF